MPVNVLLCEGGPQKPDIRLLTALLGGLCTIRPAGSKYGFGPMIRIHREVQRNATIVGLRDRDFDDDESAPGGRPRDWLIDSGATQLGWCWERVELENYLIDPAVVARALGDKAPPASEYESALRGSTESIADYQAARTALSLCRRRLRPLANAWGRERGSDNHRFPETRDETECRTRIAEIVREYEENQVVQECEALQHFENSLPVCRPSGVRFRHFLTFFSGKDLLLGMEESLIQLGFISPFEFRECVLRGIERTADDAWKWLPEWTALRQLIASYG